MYYKVTSKLTFNEYLTLCGSVKYLLGVYGGVWQKNTGAFKRLRFRNDPARWNGG